mgnify:CR=1 FL=1
MHTKVLTSDDKLKGQRQGRCQPKIPHPSLLRQHFGYFLSLVVITAPTTESACKKPIVLKNANTILTTSSLQPPLDRYDRLQVFTLASFWFNAQCGCRRSGSPLSVPPEYHIPDSQSLRFIQCVSKNGKNTHCSKDGNTICSKQAVTSGLARLSFGWDELLLLNNTTSLPVDPGTSGRWGDGQMARNEAPSLT